MTQGHTFVQTVFLEPGSLSRARVMGCCRPAADTGLTQLSGPRSFHPPTPTQLTPKPGTE